MTIPTKTSNLKKTKQSYLRHMHKISLKKGTLKEAFREKKIFSPLMKGSLADPLLPGAERLRSAPGSHRDQGKFSVLAKPGMALKTLPFLNEKSKNLWLKTFFKDGGHMGHKPLKLPISRLWYPHIGNFIIGDRNMVALINSPLTLEEAVKGLYLSAAVLRKQGHILIIDTRGETSSLPGLVKSRNDKIPTALSFSGSRWMGGSLTNWDSISVMVRRCAQISKQFDGFLAQNRIHIPRYEKMREAYPGFIKRSFSLKENLVGGSYTTTTRASQSIPGGGHRRGKGATSLPFPKPIEDGLRSQRVDISVSSNYIETQLCFKRRPDLLWVINPTENRHIIQEANRLNIPIIGLVDSNTDLSNITIPIPINTNALFQSNKLITTLLTLSNSLSSAK